MRQTKKKNAGQAGVDLLKLEFEERLEVNDRAAAELEAVLRFRIELGANVVALNAEGKTAVEAEVYAGTRLQGKSILTAERSLRNHVKAADKTVHPGLILALRIAPSDACPPGVEEILGRVASKHFCAEGGDGIAFHGEPIVKVIGQRGVKAVQICVEGSRAEADVGVTDAELEAVVVIVAVIESGFRLRAGISRWDGHGNGVARDRSDQIDAFSSGGKAVGACRVRSIETQSAILRRSKTSASTGYKYSQN